MDIHINPKGNGACSICKRLTNCPIHKSLYEGIKKVRIMKVSNNHPIEAVIYSCPAFEED